MLGKWNNKIAIIFPAFGIPNHSVGSSVTGCIREGIFVEVAQVFTPVGARRSPDGEETAVDTGARMR